MAQLDEDDTRRASLTLGYTRLLSNRQRVFTQATFEQNRELGYDLRSGVLGGWAGGGERLRLTELRREIFWDFYCGLRGYESYDGEPATEGAQKNDWGLSLTLGCSF